MSDLSKELFQSYYDEPLRKKIVEILDNKRLSDDEKIIELLKYIKEMSNNA